MSSSSFSIVAEVAPQDFEEIITTNISADTLAILPVQVDRSVSTILTLECTRVHLLQNSKVAATATESKIEPLLPPSSSETAAKTHGALLYILGLPGHCRAWTKIAAFTGIDVKLDCSAVYILADDVTSNVSCVLHFVDSQVAEKVKRMCNNRLFASGHAELCCLLDIDNLQLVEAVLADDEANTSTKAETQQQQQPQQQHPQQQQQRVISVERGHSELPCCPRCLARIDTSHTGLVRGVVDDHLHYYYSKQQAPWDNLTCPVCRRLPLEQTVTPAAAVDVNASEEGGEDSKTVTPASTVLTSSCGTVQCDVTDNSEEALWICVICAQIGCGRHNQAHAVAHFHETGHRFSIHLERHYIWDYISDRYVHRLRRLRSNGAQGYEDETGHANTVVTLGDEFSQYEADEMMQIKLHSIGQRYNELLTEQLQTQNEYFEAKISDMTLKNENEVQEEICILESIRFEADQLRNSDLKLLKTELKTVDNDISKATRALQAVQKEVQYFHNLNTLLLKDQKRLRDHPNTAIAKANAKAKKTVEIYTGLSAAKAKKITQLQADVEAIMAKLASDDSKT
jgi:hypothetical protein